MKWSNSGNDESAEEIVDSLSDDDIADVPGTSSSFDVKDIVPV